MINALALLLAFFCTPHTQQIDLSLAENVLENSALIRVKVQKGEKHDLGGCSGTLISNTQVLTAAHCFPPPDRVVIKDIWVRVYGLPVGFPARLVKLDSDKDLALLEVQGLWSKNYAKRAVSVRRGEAVICVGSPFRFEFLLSEGIVAKVGFKAKELKSSYIIHTAMINPGSSGGGAFNDKGELIGVNTFTYGGMMGWAGISGAVSLEDIEEFLNAQI